jgi:Chaperone of endosialidase
MRNKIALIKRAALLVLLSTLNHELSTLHAQGTAFTYQGRLDFNGAPANGFYDFDFALFAANSGGSRIGSADFVPGVPVSNGLFIVSLDFGANFPGAVRWLETAVRTNGAANFTPLSPRQQLTPTPYAIYASVAAGLFNGLSIQQNTNGAPNVVGGSSVNYVSSGVVGATISGGGAENYLNQHYTNSVTGSFGTVDGGAANTAGAYATVGGGYGNTASDNFTTVGGGYLNTVSDNFATVGGGSGNTASGRYATVGGGENNTASGFVATVSGGIGNTTSGDYATAGGGYGNTASDLYAAVGGGRGNTASNTYASVSGGYGNIASGESAAVGGGYLNTASGRYATVAGGTLNTASGDFSFAAGFRAKAGHQGAFVWGDSQGVDFASTANDQFLIRAQAGVGINNNNPQAPLHITGGGDAGLASGGNIISGQVSGQNLVLDNNEIISRNNGAASDLILNFGSGRVGIGRNPATNRLEVAGEASKATAGNWLANSDARIKTGVQTVTNALDKLSRVRLVQFRYTDDYRAAHPGVADRDYLNVVAQEFQKVFPEDVKRSGEKLANGDDILQVDTYPLTIYSAAAVQELNQKLVKELEQKETEITELKQRLDALERTIRPQNSN